jgi:TonB family protein
MNSKRLIITLSAAITLAWTTASIAQSDPMTTVKAGARLTADAAAQLEAGLQKKPNDEIARMKSNNVPPTTARARRLEHIAWLVENKPKSELFDWATAVWKIYAKGDPLADPAGFERVKAIWQSHIKAHPQDNELRLFAASFLAVADPETAVSWLRPIGESGFIGQIYASYLLGVIAEDYLSGDPSAIDESQRQSAVGQRILAEVRASNDAELVGRAGFLLATDGGIAYADGKTSWNYTTLAKELLAKAQTLDANNMDWFAIDTNLPARGERPARTIRIGGDGITWLKTGPPRYPAAASAKGIKGVVVLEVAIGTDGKVVKAIAQSGPIELQQAAIEAASQWEAKVQTLNGRPVMSITKVSFDFR